MANAQAQQRLLEVEASAMGKAPGRVGRGSTQKTQENLQIFLLKLFVKGHSFVKVYMLIHLIDPKFAYWHGKVQFNNMFTSPSPTIQGF